MKSNLPTLNILKIGGAVLTDKKGDHSFRASHVKTVARSIRKALHDRPQSLIIVLGVGGAVHATAKKYDLEQGANTARQIRGAITTHLQARQLQTYVCSLLLPYLAVVPLQTNNFFFLSKTGTLEFKNTAFISDLLAKNFIPVFYGDMIFDPKRNFRILSGDTISIKLANVFNPKRIVFATDVNGLYTDSTKIGQTAHLIRSLSTRALKSIIGKNNPYRASDTTGELPGKLREIMSKPARSKVFIINGLRQKNIYNCLTGATIGTEIS